MVGRAVGRTSDTRERLIEAAIDLCWNGSYGTVSVDAICERAGVKKGSFYHFFESKDHLVVEALEAHWRSRKPVLDELFSPARRPVDRLLAYFDYVFRRQTELRAQHGRVLGCLYASIGTECIRQHPAIEATVQEILGTYVRYYESALREAQAAGALRVDDPGQVARALFALMEGALGQARIADDLEPVRSLPRNARALLGIPA